MSSIITSVNSACSSYSNVRIIREADTSRFTVFYCMSALLRQMDVLIKVLTSTHTQIAASPNFKQTLDLNQLFKAEEGKE